MRWRALSVSGAVACVVLGCASSRGAPSSPANPDVITTDQIARSKATNAYELIATIRPQMFTAHGAATTRGQQPPTQGRQALPVVVYIDNVKVGPITELQALGVVDLVEIRYLSPREATDRWGEGHPGGVILVTTRQGIGPDTTTS